MTDPKVIADALDALYELANLPPEPTGSFNLHAWKIRADGFSRARAAIAALRADAAPVSTESTPDDLPNVWTVVVRGTDTVMHYGTNRAEAESRAALMRDGDGEYDAVEYVPRARIDAALNERDEARAALDKAAAEEREACVADAQHLAEHFDDCAEEVEGEVVQAAAYRERATGCREAIAAIRARGGK